MRPRECVIESGPSVTEPAPFLGSCEKNARPPAAYEASRGPPLALSLNPTHAGPTPALMRASTSSASGGGGDAFGSVTTIGTGTSITPSPLGMKANTALVAPDFFDKLISHPKVEQAYQYYSSTGAQPLREDVRRRFPFAGLVFEEYNATVTLSTGGTETLVPAGEGIAFPLGTMDTFVTYGAPANLIETVNTMGLPMYARQLPRMDGSAIDVKTEASILPVNKRPWLAVRIFSSN